jgi:ribosome biogenesis GTPase A
MTKICLGCGSILQCDDENKKGYVKKELIDEQDIICERCFKLKNYGQLIRKDEVDINKVFSKINKKDLLIYITDVLNINIINNFANPILLVLGKKDLLPKSVKDSKLITYLKDNIKNNNIIDIIILSSIKNYNMDQIYNKIMKYKKSNNIYVVGNVNAGKSTFINKFIKNYSHQDINLTISDIPGTTLDLISIFINKNLTLIDTPGILSNNIQSYLSYKELKRIIPKKEIKPIIYQLESNQTLMIDEIVRIDYIKGDKNSFTIYASNEININRSKITSHNKLKEGIKHTFEIENKDIVINGLGWIKITKKATINIYLKYDIDIIIRDPLI